MKWFRKRTSWTRLALAASIKALPLRLVAPRPLEEAISTAGGVPFNALDERLMIRTLPGLFCAGKCWIGKRRPEAISSPRVSPLVRRRAPERWLGSTSAGRVGQAEGVRLKYSELRPSVFWSCPACPAWFTGEWRPTR